MITYFEREKMKTNTILATVLLAMLCGIVVAEPMTTTGTISSVIVYRGQAMITRTLDLDLPQGNSEVIVSGLPEKLLPDSLFTQSPPNIAVISVRYREKDIKIDAGPEIQQIDAKIDEILKNVRHAEQTIQLARENINSLGRLENYNITASAADLNRGLLQADPMKTLAEYVLTKRAEYSKTITEQEDAINDLHKEEGSLRQKRQELLAGKSRREREAVLSINKTDAAKGAIELRYMISDASWTPQYNLRANSTAQNVIIEQNAIIHQASGEDWTNVAMTLSTAQPTLVAASPMLDPMMITIAPPPVAVSKPVAYKKDMSQQQNQPAVAGREAESLSYVDRTDDYRQLLSKRSEEAKKGKAGQFALNSIAVSNQLMEVMADADKVKEFKREAARVARTEGVSVSYIIPGRLTLPSRSDQQLVTITTATTKIAFTHIATPLLTDYVYVQGELTNDSGKIFLPGQTAMYRDNEFVGNGSMELVTAGEKFTMGFGVDSQVQVRRELEDKKSDIGWRTRSDRSLYRIAISNYRSTPVTLQLFDRIPFTENPDVRIELAEPSIALSKDADYLRIARKKCILRWDLKLAPNTIDGKATVITYSVLMEYPSGMQIRSEK
jgi:hypothetical protein